MRSSCYDQEIIRKEIHECIGRLSGLQAGHMPGIVLDPGTDPRLAQHFYIEIGAFFDPLCFQQFVFLLEITDAFFQFCFDRPGRTPDRLCRHHVVRCRIDMHKIQVSLFLSCQQINLGNPVDLIPEELHADRCFTFFGRYNLQHIPVNPERASVEIDLIAFILDIDQFADHLIPVFLHAGPQRNDHFFIIFRAAQTVNAGNTGYHDHVFPLDQRRRGGKPELIDFFIAGRVFGDICIRRRHIRLRLIVIVIGDEILHRVFREELLKFRVQLGGQRLVMGYDQRGFLQTLDHIGHGECFTGTGRSQKRLTLVSFAKPGGQFFYGLRLITRRHILCMQLEFHS